jgi:hypothetical protein
LRAVLACWRERGITGFARPADEAPVRLRTLLALVAGVFAVSQLVGESTTATAGSRTCGGTGGYTYAGHQATRVSHGVRATITLTSAPRVQAGHVSGWVGVGGPGQGAGGEDAWIQVGAAAMRGAEPFLYAEITQPGRQPQLVLLEAGVQVGQSRALAVLEVAGRPGSWRVWVDGRPATKPVYLRGSSGRWAPIATAESWNGGEGACNTFAYRFEHVSVSHGAGGSWKPFVSGHRFLDPGYELRPLAASPQGARRLSASGNAPLPYTFLASS